MIRQKQVQHLSYANLTALTNSGLSTPEFSYIQDQNAFYTRIAGVNTLIGAANANLSLGTNTSSTLDVLIDSGTDVTLPAATVSLAGLMTATDKVNLNALVTLSGVTAGSTNLGTFTGTIIPDNTTIKTALQSLETSLELRALDSAVVHIAGAETITGVKTFSAQPVGITASSIVNVAAGNIAATTVQAAINELDSEKQAISEKGQINGYASLDGTGKVPASQLPSYVDDVLEFTTQAGFPATGETGKLYVVTTGVDANKIYRWTGSVYVEVSPTAGAPVSSVFGRTGAVVATSGDYTASQVTNVAANTISATTVQAAIDELSIEKQEKIQYQDEGVNQGALGSVTTLNVVGVGANLNVSGAVATLTITKGFNEQIVTLTPTGANTIPNLTPLPSDSSKVKIFVNSALAENNGITVNSSGVFSINTVVLGYSIDTSDKITCHYIN